MKPGDVVLVPMPGRFQTREMAIVLGVIAAQRGTPEVVFLDNGRWTYSQDVDFLDAGFVLFRAHTGTRHVAAKPQPGRSADSLCGRAWVGDRSWLDPKRGWFRSKPERECRVCLAMIKRMGDQMVAQYVATRMQDA